MSVPNPSQLLKLTWEAALALREKIAFFEDRIVTTQRKGFTDHHTIEQIADHGRARDYQPGHYHSRQMVRFPPQPL